MTDVGNGEGLGIQGHSPLVAIRCPTAEYFCILDSEFHLQFRAWTF